MDCVAELGNSALQPMDDPIFLTFIECGGTTFLIDLTRTQQCIDQHENLMRQGNNRLLLPAPRGQPTINCGQERVGLLDGSPGRLDQRAPQIRVPIANARALALAGAFVLPWRQSRPTARRRWRGEPSHVRARYDQIRLGRALPSPGIGTKHLWGLPRAVRRTSRSCVTASGRAVTSCAATIARVWRAG